MLNISNYTHIYLKKKTYLILLWALPLYLSKYFFFKYYIFEKAFGESWYNPKFYLKHFQGNFILYIWKGFWRKLIQSEVLFETFIDLILIE